MKASKVAGKNVSLPVLEGLYLSAHKNVLNIKATNLDLGISISIPVKVVEPGTVVIQAQTITSLVSSLSGDRSITIASKGQTIEVKTHSTKSIIKTLPSDDFPIIPEITDDKNFSILTRDLNLGIRSVIYAAAVGSIKPELSSISISHEGEHLVFAATDSFRLAEKKIKIKGNPHFKQILLPQKNATEIIRIFDKPDEEISLSVEEHQIALHTNGIYLTSRVIEGRFPDYRQIIPKELSTKAIVLKQDLLSSLKTSLIFSDSFNQLNLNLLPKGKKFEIESKNTNIGENTYNIDASLEGEDLLINVNHKYFTDCFQSISSDSVSLGFSGQARPILLEGVGDKTFLYLVMPMNRS